jgi:hypothetical protein
VKLGPVAFARSAAALAASAAYLISLRVRCYICRGISLRPEKAHK